MNEETIIEKRPEINGQPENKKNGVAWKQVTLGGVSGILMGAGLMYAGQASAKVPESAETPEEPQDVQTPEQGETSYTLENGLKVAAVNDDLSFGEAFAAARAEVGPGGVFHWHGGIYNTYSADEWNAMTIEQKHDFAQQVQPEVSANELSTPTDANTHVVVEHHVYHHEESHSTEDVHQAAETTSEDVQVVDQQTTQEAEQDSDVHIVGYATVDGHLVAGFDTDGDNQADVAIIDIDDNHQISENDIIVDREGHAATVGDVVNTPDADSDQMMAMENPDVATDMPDYMNDVNIDA